MAVYQVAAQQLWREEQCINVHHYVTANPLSEAQQQELTDAMRAAYTLLDPGGQMDNNWSFTSCIIRRVDEPDLPGALYVPTAGAYVGQAAATNTMINQACALVSWYAPTQKPRRGRTYLPGTHSVSLTDTGVYTTSFQALMADWADAVMAIALTGDTAAKAAVQWLPGAGAASLWNEYTAYVVRGNPAVQRRRRKGSGV